MAIDLTKFLVLTWVLASGVLTDSGAASSPESVTAAPASPRQDAVIGPSTTGNAADGIPLPGPSVLLLTQTSLEDGTDDEDSRPSSPTWSLSPTTGLGPNPSRPAGRPPASLTGYLFSLHSSPTQEAIPPPRIPL